MIMTTAVATRALAAALARTRIECSLACQQQLQQQWQQGSGRVAPCHSRLPPLGWDSSLPRPLHCGGPLMLPMAMLTVPRPPLRLAHRGP